MVVPMSWSLSGGMCALITDPLIERYVNYVSIRSISVSAAYPVIIKAYVLHRGVAGVLVAARY